MEESFSRGGRGSSSIDCRAGGGANGGSGGHLSFGFGGAGAASCGGGGELSISLETGGSAGSGEAEITSFDGGGGVSSTVGPADSGVGTGLSGAATSDAGGGGAASATGMTVSRGGSGLGGGVLCTCGAGAFSAAGGAGAADFGARICVCNSVKEECFDGSGSTVSDSVSGEIGSSNLSSQRRIWSRECEGSPANSSVATRPPSSRRLTIASPSIRAALSSAKAKGIFSDGCRGIIARREKPYSERSRIIPPFEGGSST